MMDSKTGVGFAYLALSIIGALLAVEYLGVVKPDALGTDMFTENLIVPLAFNYGKELRIVFVVSSVLISLVSPSADMLGDSIARIQKMKYFIFSLLGLASFGLIVIENLHFILFAVGYPVFSITVLITSFIVPNLLKIKKANKDTEWGFKNAKQLVESDTTFNWESDGEYINIENPARGIFVMGGPGAGKSWTIGDEIIVQSVQKFMTGFIYDYKFPTLTKICYDAFINAGSVPMTMEKIRELGLKPGLKADPRKLWMVNFTDIRYSHQVNPIAPEYVKSQIEASEAAETLLRNLDPEFMKKSDFFSNSALATVTGVIWFLCKKFKEMCTLPHLVFVMMQDYEKILAMLRLDDDTAEIVASLRVADKKNAESQIAGVIATVQIMLIKLMSPEMTYILSGNQVNLKVNDPENPAYLCVGNDPNLKQTIGPVCALIAKVVMRLINAKGRMPCIYFLDEAPTIQIPGLNELPATGRSNGVITVVIVQDKAQMELTLSTTEAKSLSATLNNLFFGQTGDLDSAKMISEIIGQREKEKISTNSSSSNGESQSKSKGENRDVQEKPLIQPYELMSLPRGTFVGKVAEVETEYKYDPFFKLKPKVTKGESRHAFNHVLRKDERGETLTEAEARELVHNNHIRLRKEAQNLVDICARKACELGLGDETKIYPTHFYKNHRIVNTDGTLAVKGIEYDRLTGVVTGIPQIEVAE